MNSKAALKNLWDNVGDDIREAMWEDVMSRLTKKQADEIVATYRDMGVIDGEVVRS